MPANLTSDIRNQIVFLHDQGRNISEISRELNISRSTVRRWVNRNADEGSTTDHPRASRRRILNTPRKDRMKEIYTERPFTKTAVFANQFSCSLRTVQRGLHEIGFHHRRPSKKIVLNEQQKIARVQFARDYRDFDFSYAIFSDEKSFTSSQHGRLNLWRTNNTRYEPRNVLPNKSSGRIIVNMWGWMSAAGPGELVYIDRRANGQSHAELLQQVMLPTVRTVYPRDAVPFFYFFQDNCPIHRARVVRDWLEQQQEIRTVPWPSRSPDLNPIENLWAMCAQTWDNRDERTKPALVAHCDEVWNSFRGSNFCEVLVSSMRDRLDAVIDAGGAMTKY